MKRIILTASIVLVASHVIAQGSGLEMLNISPTPYSLSRAEATTSIPDGSASIYSNPGLLALSGSSTIDLGYSFWIADVTNVFGGVNFRNNKRAVALSFYSSGSDDYQQRNGPGPSNGDFSIQYLSVAAAYSYDFELFSLGGAFQYLNEESYIYQASGYAFNFGIARQFLDGRIRTGASITNLGEMDELDVEATKLPSNLRVGLSADLFEIATEKNSDFPVLLSVFTDFVNPLNDSGNKDYTDYSASEPYLNAGLSVEIAEVIEVSGGFKSGDNARPFSFGTAVITDIVKFNYALIPFNTGFGTVHSIGIQYKF